MSNTIIRVENVSKQYRLGEVGTGSISHDINRWWHKMQGKEDPYLKIGEINDRTIKGSSDYVWALKDINFDVEQGEIVGIIGRNGAGKSTLLKILSRTTLPTTGSVKIRGKIASLLEVGTGFHPDLSGRENVFLNGAILGMTKNEIKSKFDEIVDFAGVEKYIDTPVKRYSSGMYVRLAFAVAAHLEPEILIIDEVLAVGDAAFQKKCLGKMKDVSKQDGRTILFVSHNMGVISQLCEKAIVLKNGNILDMGVAQDMVAVYSQNNATKNNIYEASEETVKLKNNYLSHISMVDESGKINSDFPFNSSAILKLRFVVKDLSPGLQIGVGMNDKFETRIFTIVREIAEFEKKGNDYSGELILPPSLFAPNNYTFTIALWTKDGKLYDIIENTCSIKIFDTGTYLALYEGVDYGSIIVNPNWKNV